MKHLFYLPLLCLHCCYLFRAHRLGLLQASPARLPQRGNRSGDTSVVRLGATPSRGVTLDRPRCASASAGHGLPCAMAATKDVTEEAVFTNAAPNCRCIEKRRGKPGWGMGGVRQCTAKFGAKTDGGKDKVARAPACVSPSVNDVVPILSRLGCSAGACHGAAQGKGGFRLSLRGYAPR